ncbi:MAG: Cys-tRNA(Pro) deacylase [Lachnospiraceae bacterium]|nr:Cys-tRNA(Pro) deacylase [Lachnospiraceae bacterium]
MKKNDKTNVMRVLDSRKIDYKSHMYEVDPKLTGGQIAGILNEDASKVFKTLVTQGKSGQYYVFVIPVEGELDLKKAANAAKEKSIAMLKQKDLLGLTGYVHGGCSPIGMKRAFTTFIHETAKDYDKMFVSAGKVGYQIEINPMDLEKVIRCTFADVAQI